MVNWGIIGCGEVTRQKILPSFARVRGARVVAVADREPDRAQELARRFSAPEVYESAGDLLGSRSVDAVYIATPPNLHHEHSILAARAGKHVLCEKPMAVNIELCRSMIRAARDAGVVLSVAYYRRFWEQTQLIKQLIAKGSIGEPVNARVLVTGNMMREPHSVLRWKLDPAVSGGGFLMDVGCHRVDLLLFLLGEPVDVTAFADSYQRRHRVDDLTNLLIRFRSGALASLSFNWVVDAFADEMEIIGTGGRLIASPLGGDRVLAVGGPDAGEHVTPRPSSTHGALLAHCCRTIRGEERNAVSGEVGLSTAEVIEAAYRSSAERQTIALAGAAVV